MNKLFSYILLSLFFLTLPSCKKDNERVKVTTIMMNVSIKANEHYQYSIGHPCDECGLVINRQAMHYNISEIMLDTTSLNPLSFIYKYTPTLNYVGPDEIEIKSSAGSDGSGPNNIITLTTIKFTITN